MRQLAATCAHRVRVAAVLLGKKTHPKWSQFAAVDATLFCYFHGYGISLLGARTTELPHSCWSYIQFLVVCPFFSLKPPHSCQLQRIRSVLPAAWVCGAVKVG